MAPGYGISGIGFSPLGTMRLSSSGMYGSYDPMMMGAYGGLGFGGYGMGMGMPGMGNMGNIYSQYAQMMAQMEEYQLQHAQKMHGQMLNNEVIAAGETDSANARKNLIAASVRSDLRQLVNQIEAGHSDGICEAFSALREQVLSTYKDEFAEREDKENVYKAANRRIAELYFQETGRDIYDDIKTHCESAAKNGFMQGFRPGHDKRDVQEVLNYCFGDKIAEYEHEQRMKDNSYIGGRIARGAVDGAATGAIAGTVAGVTTFGGAKLIKAFSSESVKKSIKPFKFGGKVGAIVGLIGLGVGAFCPDLVPSLLK